MQAASSNKHTTRVNLYEQTIKSNCSSCSSQTSYLTQPRSWKVFMQSPLKCYNSWDTYLEEIGHAPLHRSTTGCDRTSSAGASGLHTGLNDLFISVGTNEWFLRSQATNGFIARTLSALPLYSRSL